METLPIADSQQDSILAALGQCPLFRALKPEHLPQVMKLAELNQFHADEPIIRQGDASDSFYLLISGVGRVTVEKGGEPLEIGRMEPPSSVGEMGLLMGEPRTASVIAVGEVQALKFGAKAFDAMFQKIPNFGMGLSRGLATRLHQVSGKVPLPDYDPNDGLPGSGVVEMLPIEIMQRHRVLPLRVEGNVLTLGMVDDPTPQVMSAIRELLPSFEFRPMHITPGTFDEVMKQHGGLGLKGWGSERAAQRAAEQAPEGARSPRLDAMLTRIVAEGASDLHLSGGHRPFWRIDGEMRTMADIDPLGPEEVLDLLRPVMSKRHLEQFAEENDTDFAYALPDVARFRVNLFRDNNGVGTVMRQIPSKVLTFDQLNLPPVLKMFCDMPKGLVLITGPTGSGKSTTLAAMVDYINKTYAAHITTMEDPIEFVHVSQKCLVNQREVGGHTTSFGRALKAVLREDPDIVLVGEMRDLETIALALETANTGHLVFATLHTNSAISSVDRIIDMFPAHQQEQIRAVLADVLRGVVSQTLLKKKGGGRLAALEVLVVNFAASNLIRESKIHQLTTIMQAGKQFGNQLLNDELSRIFDERKVEWDEILGAATDKADMIRRYRSGLTIANDPPSFERFRVMEVKPDTPGALAGFSRGDLIVDINKRPAKEFSLEEVRQLTRSDGRNTFGLDKQGKRREVTLELKREL